jgi:hypothetical protein
MQPIFQNREKENRLETSATETYTAKKFATENIFINLIINLTFNKIYLIRIYSCFLIPLF